VAIVGPGLWSVDALLFGPRDEVAVEDAIRSPIQSGPLPHHAPAPA